MAMLRCLSGFGCGMCLLTGAATAAQLVFQCHRRSRTDVQQRTGRKNQLVVFRIPTPRLAQLYNLWLKKGKPSGGPEQLLSAYEQQHIKTELLKSLGFEAEEIADIKV